MKRAKKATAQAEVNSEPSNDAGGVEPVEEEQAAADEYAVDTVKDNGHLSRSYGRRARAHIARDSNDRDNRDVTDVPPPGWPV